MKKPAPSPFATEAHCPECDAPAQDGFNCWGMLGAILAWEGQDAELLAEHFKTVASYNLQHPAQFEAAVLQGLRAAYVAHLDEGLPAAEIRRRMRAATAGARRVLKPSAARQPVLRVWTMTVADVYAQGAATGAAKRVRAWAAAIRAELG